MRRRLQKTENGKQKTRAAVLFCTLYAVLCTLFPAHLHACPLCKEAVEKAGEIFTSLGFNWSIFFMLLVPVILVSGFSGALYWNYKKHAKS